MSNLKLYNAVRSVPENAKKRITGGRLSGMTDINPMWRIKTLTEQFGICGIGWKYVITDKRLEQGANGEIAAFVDIDLYIKIDGEWSEPIPGTGGSMFVAKERNGMYTSDECFKMALTDALSVACKALGFAADVYFEKDRTKYNTPQGRTQPMSELTKEQIDALYKLGVSKGLTQNDIIKATRHYYKKATPEELTKKEYDSMIERINSVGGTK
jgi:hypothetical protein